MKTFLIVAAVIILICVSAALFEEYLKPETPEQNQLTVQLSDSQLVEFHRIDSMFAALHKRYHEVLDMRGGCVKCHPKFRGSWMRIK